MIHIELFLCLLFGIQLFTYQLEGRISSWEEFDVRNISTWHVLSWSLRLGHQINIKVLFLACFVCCNVWYHFMLVNSAYQIYLIQKPQIDFHVIYGTNVYANIEENITIYRNHYLYFWHLDMNKWYKGEYIIH